MVYPLEQQHLVGSTICKAKITNLNVQVRIYAQPYRGTLLTEQYLPLCQILPDSIQLTELSVLNLINLSMKPAHAALSLGLPSIANLLVSVWQASSTYQIKACTVITLCR